MVEAEAIGLQREFPQVGPEAVLGLEVNPYAAELARVSVWIGHIQWARRHGFPAPSDPVLRTLDTIACRDAVLADDGRQAAWPRANVIVGNPPFLGDKTMPGTLGEKYTLQLRRTYHEQVPGSADLVCYWFERAREEIACNRTKRVGFVSTQSIRKGSNHAVLSRIRETGVIFDAWDDEPWTVDGADVRVSLVCFSGKDNEDLRKLDGQPVAEIFSDLSAGGSDITQAYRLIEDRGFCHQGPVKVGAFDVDGATARQWLTEPSNANGRHNSDVVRPWINGMDLTRRPSDTWIIDFSDMNETEAAFFSKSFAHVALHVKPEREQNRRDRRRRMWWQHGETVPGLRAALKPLSRFIATPRVAKHRIFAWCPVITLPDSRVYAIARDDDVTFGILQSRFHECWALQHASRHGVGNDPTYNSLTCFETFPFPPGLTPNRAAASYADDPRAQDIAQAAKALVTARDRWLNPPELVIHAPEVVLGFPERLLPRNALAAATLRSRTLTALYNQHGKPERAWLDSLHRTLDEAVAAAYGWPADLLDGEVLARLLALNHERSLPVLISN